MKFIFNRIQKVLFLLTWLYIFSPASIQAIELNRVILATNNDITYIQFWQVVAPLWSKMGLKPTLALIADENCVVDTTLGDVIRFDPIPGVSQALQAQAIRLLLPILFPDDGCIISDIDMLPISREYFFEGASHCPDDGFLIYRNGAYGGNEKKYPMCYFAAKGDVFQSVFGISKLEEIDPLLQQWASMGYGWNTDELMLYQYVNDWQISTGKVVYLGHGVGPRIDRMWWFDQLRFLDVRNAIDCHCPRPYSINKQTIDQVVDATFALWAQQDGG